MKNEAQPIAWSAFQQMIAPMWNEPVPHNIPIINNPFQIIQYDLAEWRSKIYLIPYAFYVDGVCVGCTCMYNVTDTIIRVRGIYIFPEFRGNGFAHTMLSTGMNLFPDTFGTLIGLFKEETHGIFLQHGFRIIPSKPLWSSYSNATIIPLFKQYPRTNNHVLDISRYGLCGDNNLNQSMTHEEWLNYAAPHAWVYPNGEIDLSSL